MESDEYSTDNEKRKRGKEWEEDVFNKSKKINRSPIKNKKQEEEKMDKILSILQKLSGDIEDMKEEQKENTKQYKLLNEKIEKISEENARIKKENENIERENKEIKEEMRKLIGKVEVLDKDRRLNNIIVQGIEIDTSDGKIIKEAMENLIKKHVKVDVEIYSAHKLGKATCLVKMNNNQDKTKVMQNKNRLRNLKEQKVYINHDLTEDEMSMQKTIRERAQEEKRRGKQTKTGYGKIEIDGVLWKWNKERKMLEERTKN